MRSLFRSKHRITQAFGVNEAYYKQFGLKGHEGLDLVPTGTVWDVLCLEDGVVVRDIDDVALGKNYGKNVTVWHPTIKKATQYCHLAENYVKMGDRLTKGDKLGLMGSTGNTSGAHVHLNLFDVDENGLRLNRENGYFGGIDPLLFLEEDTQVADDLQTELDKVRKERDTNWNAFTTLCDALQAPHDVNVALAEVKKLIELEDQLVKTDSKLKEATIKIADLDTQLKTLQTQNDALQEDNKKLKEEVDVQFDTITKQDFSIKVFQEQIDVLKVQAKLPIFKSWKLAIVQFLAKI